MNIEEIKTTLNYLLDNNLKLVDKGLDKIAINIVGEAGIGKTSCIKQLAEERNAGYTRINLSELEEVGDIVGVPVKKYCMLDKDKQNEYWITEKVVNQYTEMGFTMCPDCEPRMEYAVPSWVPLDPEQEFILFLDDFSRANPLFMQAIMSLIQFGEYVSWKLPKKCHLILSSNPDSGDYNVTDLDPAQRSRMINFNVDFDVKVYAKWAQAAGVRTEMINFALLTPEMFSRKKSINARSYTMFANAISGLKSFDSDEALETVSMIAKGCFDDDWVSGMFIQFVHNKLDKLINPDEMLNGDWDSVKNKLIDNIYRQGKYDAAIASTLTLRFTSYIDLYFKDAGAKSTKVIDRIIDICTFEDKTILTEDLLYRMIKGLVANYPQRCQKLLMYPQIRNKVLG